MMLATKQIFQPHKYTPTIGAFLCAVVISLPFSVALANILLACSLLIGVISGRWWYGASILWQQAKPLTITWFAYIALMLAGLLWSPDIPRGLVVISKQWSWLIIPIFLAICEDPKWRQRILFSISIGLLLHLLLCVAQSQGIPLPVKAPGGSSLQDPAGLIGHISFGLVYGIWAAWLLHTGILKKGNIRYALWALAAFATVWVFIVQGRSGYIVITVLAITMTWKLWIQHLNIRLIFNALFISIIVFTAIAMGPAKERILSTIDSLKAFSQGDLEHAEERASIWYLAWESWKTKPLTGIGTGGFPSVSNTFITKQHSNLNLHGQTNIAVPHNIYLMALVRCGPLGLVILLLFLSFWIRQGWKLDWQQPNFLLIALSGIALSVHGLTSQSIEEYHASIYTAIFLSIGLASLKNNYTQSLRSDEKNTSH